MFRTIKTDDFYIDFSLNFMFFPEPLPEGIFGGPERQSILTMMVLERFLVFLGTQHRAWERPNAAQGLLGSSWDAPGHLRAATFIFHGFATDLGAHLDGIPTFSDDVFDIFWARFGWFQSLISHGVRRWCSAPLTHSLVICKTTALKLTAIFF